jgi:hypothetical protein
MPCTDPPASLPLSASPHLNLRGLVFNFFKKRFCGSFFFSTADFFSFLDIDNFLTQNCQHFNGNCQKLKLTSKS